MWLEAEFDPQNTSTAFKDISSDGTSSVFEMSSLDSYTAANNSLGTDMRRREFARSGGQCGGCVATDGGHLSPLLAKVRRA